MITTAKVITRTTAVTNQDTQNKSKTLISKAKQTNKALKSGKVCPRATKKEAVINQATTAKSSDSRQESGSGQFKKKSEICRESVVVENDTPSDSSQNLVGAGSAPKKSNKIYADTTSTTSDKPQTGDNHRKCLPDKSKATDRDSMVKMEAEVDKLPKKTTKKKPAPPCKKMVKTSVKEEASKDASDPMQLGESGNEAVQLDGTKSCVDVKEDNVTTKTAVPEKTDKYMQSQPAASTARTPSTKKGIINKQGNQMIMVEKLQVLQFHLHIQYQDRTKDFYLFFFLTTTISHLFNCRRPSNCWGSDRKTPGYKTNR